MPLHPKCSSFQGFPMLSPVSHGVSLPLLSRWPPPGGTPDVHRWVPPARTTQRRLARSIDQPTKSNLGDLRIALPLWSPSLRAPLRVYGTRRAVSPSWACPGPAVFRRCDPSDMNRPTPGPGVLVKVWIQRAQRAIGIPKRMLPSNKGHRYERSDRTLRTGPLALLLGARSY